MAIMVDQKSTEYQGEATFWQALFENLPDSVVVYNNREIKGREYDFCLLIEGVGILVIEVKGWLASKINVLGNNEIAVQGYTTTQGSPKKQSRVYRFAIRESIQKKYKLSPLVLDMVAYPFITEEEYHQVELNKVCEQEYVLFKEDLTTQEALYGKILKVFAGMQNLPHDEFTKSLMLNLRTSLEPNFIIPQSSDDINAYSELHIFPDNIQEEEADSILANYFKGVKQFIFTSSRNDFNLMTDRLNLSFKKHGIQPNKGNLEFKYKNSISNTTVYIIRIFNFEMYLVSSISDICNHQVAIMEGIMSDEERAVLERLTLLTEFNLQQYQVEHASADNHILVEAGAGTGKTYSMISRIAYLCGKKERPITNLTDEIAMVTFTNDAASNMKERLKLMFENYFILTCNVRYLHLIEDVNRANISTIHKFALRILRNDSMYTGLGVDFDIRSDEYRRGKLYDKYLDVFFHQDEEHASEMDHLPVPVYELKKKLMAVADKLLQKSVCLENLMPYEMGVTQDNNLPYFNDLIRQVIQPAEVEYSLTLKVTDGLDLRDCIIQLQKVLTHGSKTLSFFKFRYIFIDEFQDTDDVQIDVFKNIQKAMQGECRLFVVGDLKQSIYRFRGARLSAFDQLREDNEFDWSVCHLSTNYRTDANLLEAFNPVFMGMGVKKYLPYTDEDRLVSHVDTGVTDGQYLIEIPCHGKDEIDIFDTLFDTLAREKYTLEQLSQTVSLNKHQRTIAILVRSNWQVDRIIDEGEKRGINIQIKTGGDLFQLRSTQDFYRLILALTNTRNPVCLINFLESSYADIHMNYSSFYGLPESQKLEKLTDALDQLFVQKMHRSWTQAIRDVYSQPVLYILKTIFDALEPWKQYSTNKEDREFYISNYDFLLEHIIRYARIDTLSLSQIQVYLEINILTGQQQLSRDKDTSDDGISILCTTVHKSKGLEYGTVVLPYTGDDISSSKKARTDANYSNHQLSYTVEFENHVREHNSNFDQTTETEEQIAEESRILYVAMTRAIRRCVWIHNIDHDSPDSWASLLEV